MISHFYVCHSLADALDDAAALVTGDDGKGALLCEGMSVS